MMCSPAENLPPGSFPVRVMLGAKPELSVAVGVVHVTVADVVPRSAFAAKFRGQLKNVGLEMSWTKLIDK